MHSRPFLVPHSWVPCSVCPWSSIYRLPRKPALGKGFDSARFDSLRCRRQLVNHLIEFLVRLPFVFGMTPKESVTSLLTIALGIGRSYSPFAWSLVLSGRKRNYLCG